MVDRDSDVADGGVASIYVRERSPERTRVRRRRSSECHRPRWSARSSKKRQVRVLVLCATVLLLMSLGLYFSLARQEAAPDGEHGALGSRVTDA